MISVSEAAAAALEARDLLEVAVAPVSWRYSGA